MSFCKWYFIQTILSDCTHLIHSTYFVMTSTILDLEAKCSQSDSDDPCFSDLELQDEDIESFIDNDAKGNSFTFYQNIDNCLKVRKRLQSDLHSSSVKGESTVSLKQQTDSVIASNATKICPMERSSVVQSRSSFSVSHQVPSLQSMSFEDIIYAFHFQTCSTHVRQKIQRYVWDKFEAVVPPLLPFLMGACRKFLDSLPKRTERVVITSGTQNLASHVTQSSRDQSLLSGSYPRTDISQDTTPPYGHDYLNDRDNYLQSFVDSENSRGDETYQTLAMLVATRETHRVMAITSSIVKHANVDITRWRAEPSELDRIISLEYDRLLTRTGRRRRSKRGGKCRRRAKEQTPHSVANTSSFKRRQRRSTKRSRRFSNAKVSKQIHHLH